MKIISKNKDYYDFVVGHDTDPRKVYVRNIHIIGTNRDIDSKLGNWTKKIKNSHEFYPNKYYPKRFYIGYVWFCDVRYKYFYDSETNTYYYKYEDIPESIINCVEKHYMFNLGKPNTHIDLYQMFYPKTTNSYHYYRPLEDKDKDEPIRKSIINKESGVPVIFYRFRDVGMELVLNGCLSEVGFKQVKTPTQAYQELYNWIPYIEPETDSDPTNMIRFQSKGFDAKTSFRPKIK